MLWEEMAGAAECRQSGKLSLKKLFLSELLKEEREQVRLFLIRINCFLDKEIASAKALR